MLFRLKYSMINTEYNRALRELFPQSCEDGEDFEALAKSGHSPNSLPILIRYLPKAEEFETPLLIDSIKSIISEGMFNIADLDKHEMDILEKYKLID
jgi:hypothetical protein